MSPHRAICRCSETAGQADGRAGVVIAVDAVTGPLLFQAQFQHRSKTTQRPVAMRQPDLRAMSIILAPCPEERAGGIASQCPGGQFQIGQNTTAKRILSVDA